MTENEARLEVRKLLEGLSDAEVHAMCVEALRSWRAKLKPVDWEKPHYTPSIETFQLHDGLGREILPLLAKRKGVTVTDVDALKEPFINSLYNTWMSGVMEFIWWLVRAGLAVDTQREKHGYPVTMRLTERGIRFLTEGDDHPMLPGFLARVRLRCANLPDGVEALLVDARACLDYGLLRPAVVLMGVAYELAIEHVVEAMVTKNYLHTNTPNQKPAEKISRILAFIRSTNANAEFSADERTAAERAYDFADTLRLRRNEAAHTTPRFDFAHRAETEEFLISAGRHLPALWSLAR